MEGHADYGPHGMDIVCSANSILFYSLIASLKRKTLPFPLNAFVLQYDDGSDEQKNWIKVSKIETPFMESVHSDIDFFMNGIALLERDYPLNVKLLFTDSCQN